MAHSVYNEQITKAFGKVCMHDYSGSFCRIYFLQSKVNDIFYNLYIFSRVCFRLQYRVVYIGREC